MMKVDPHNVDAHHYLGDTLRDSASQPVGATPANRSETRDKRGIRTRMEESVTEYQAALKLKPDSVEVSIPSSQLPLRFRIIRTYNLSLDYECILCLNIMCPISPASSLCSRCWTVWGRRCSSWSASTTLATLSSTHSHSRGLTRTHRYPYYSSIIFLKSISDLSFLVTLFSCCI